MRVNVTKRYRRASDADPGKVNTYEPGVQDMPDADARACIGAGYGEKPVLEKQEPQPENKMERAPKNKARTVRKVKAKRNG